VGICDLTTNEMCDTVDLSSWSERRLGSYQGAEHPKRIM